MPQDFLPADDTGVVQIQVQAANGTSYERMVEYGKQVADIVNADPNTKGAMFQVNSSGAGSNSAQVRSDAEAAQGPQAVGRADRAGSAPQGIGHHGHQRVRDEPAGAADRRPQLALELSVHAPGRRPRPAPARRDGARGRAQDDAGLHRREQRLRQGRAVARGRNRPRPRRGARRRGLGHRGRDGLFVRRPDDHADLRVERPVPGDSRAPARAAAQRGRAQDAVSHFELGHARAAVVGDQVANEHDPAHRESLGLGAGSDDLVRSR